jgi:hypothetical protein
MMMVEVVGFDAKGQAHRTVLPMQDGAVLADLFPVLAAGNHPLCLLWPRAAGFALWGRTAGPDSALRDGDQVALLSALKADPKEARRLRVEGARRANAEQGRFDRWTRSR